MTSENRWLRIYGLRTKQLVGELRVTQATNDYSKINVVELIRIIETAVEEISLLQGIIAKLKNAEIDVLDNLCGEFLNYVIANELGKTIDEFDELLKEETENGS